MAFYLLQSVNMKTKLVGISGSFASGQDTLAKHLRDNFGFVWFSTSDMVRQFSRKRHGSIERPYLAETATFLRNSRGGGVLVELGFEEYEKGQAGKGLVMSGVRSLGEMKAILDKGGVVVYVDADPKLRFERMIARQRDAESQLSKEEFLAREQAEWHTGDTDADFNKRDIRAHAEAQGLIIRNDGDLQTYLSEAEQKLGL